MMDNSHRQILVTGLGGGLDERNFPDISTIRSIVEAVAWLRGAGRICRETARHTGDPKQAEYLLGRAHAFGLAARVIEDVSGGVRNE